MLVEYAGLKVKDLDVIRAKIRESGGEFHVLKNTLARKAFEARGMSVPESLLAKSTAVAFAFSDAASASKR